MQLVGNHGERQGTEAKLMFSKQLCITWLRDKLARCFKSLKWFLWTSDVCSIVKTLKYYNNIMNIYDNISNISLIHYSDQSDQSILSILSFISADSCLSTDISTSSKCQVCPLVKCYYANTVSSIVVVLSLFQIICFLTE